MTFKRWINVVESQQQDLLSAIAGAEGADPKKIANARLRLKEASHAVRQAAKDLNYEPYRGA